MENNWKFAYPKDLWDIRDIEKGTIMADFISNNIRCLVIRGPCNYCAYLGVPSGHPLAGYDYNNIPLNVHGGLTFAGEGDGYRPKGYYWYGWDYGHCEDWSVYLEDLRFLELSKEGRKKWTLGEVVREVEEVLWDFEKIMKFAEEMYKKIMWEPKK